MSQSGRGLRLEDESRFGIDRQGGLAQGLSVLPHGRFSGLAQRFRGVARPRRAGPITISSPPTAGATAGGGPPSLALTCRLGHRFQLRTAARGRPAAVLVPHPPFDTSTPVSWRRVPFLLATCHLLLLR